MRYKLVRATKVAKSAGSSQLLTQCMQVASSSGIRDLRVSLFLADSPHSSVSAVERVAKAFPFLREYIVETTNSFDPQQIPYKVITTLSGRWRTATTNRTPLVSLPIDVVSEIAAGVPKRWPANDFLLVLDLEAWPGMPSVTIDESDIALLGDDLSPTNPQQYYRPSIIISSHWWTPRRLNSLLAIVPFDSDGSESTVPVPSETAKTLDALGKPAGTTVRPLLTTADAANLRRVRDRFSEFAQTYISDAHRHLLPVADEQRPIKIGDPAAKGAILRAFRGTGFTYEWLARGVYRLVKYSPAGLRCAVEIDVAPMARVVRVEYCLEGPSISVRTPVAICPGQPAGRQEAIDPPERLDGLLSNAARVVKFYEEQLRPAAEQILPTCPRWLRSVQ